MASLELLTPSKSVDSSRDRASVACLESVDKNYGRIRALAGCSFEARRGELLAVLGPNGAGKTTAIRLLLGLARPSFGRVSVFGSNPTATETRAQMGAMLQVGRVPETLRVREHIDLFSSYYPRPFKLDETLTAAGLNELQDRKFGALSSGQKQRVLFALAICGDPDLLFLDEPTVGLDVEARRQLWQQIRRLLARGKTIVLTTHYLEEADALADRIVVLDKGAVVAAGSPAEIKARVGGKRIRCVTALSTAELHSLPGVVGVRAEGGTTVIDSSQPELVLRYLFDLDPSLAGIEVTSAGLEEAFLSLTGMESISSDRKPN